MRSNGNKVGTDNVLADLGFEDAQELSAQAVLAVKLNELIEKRGLSQTEGGGHYWHDATQGLAGAPLQAPEYFA